MTRGGKRPGAGRPLTGKKTTKITVYEETRNSLNKYAAELDIPVVQLMEFLVQQEDFYEYLKKAFAKL